MWRPRCLAVQVYGASTVRAPPTRELAIQTSIPYPKLAVHNHAHVHTPPKSPNKHAMYRKQIMSS